MGYGFRVCGLRLVAEGLKFGVLVSWFEIEGLGFTFQGSGCRENDYG